MAQDLETIVRETKRCRDIVRGLLDFARQVPPHKTDIDINESIDWALDIVDHQREVGHISVTKSFAENLPKTRSGKIMRRLLRTIARGDEITQDTSTLENESILVQLRGHD